MKAGVSDYNTPGSLVFSRVIDRNSGAIDREGLRFAGGQVPEAGVKKLVGPSVLKFILVFEKTLAVW
jgi:hypothetical protein